MEVHQDRLKIKSGMQKIFFNTDGNILSPKYSLFYIQINFNFLLIFDFNLCINKFLKLILLTLFFSQSSYFVHFYFVLNPIFEVFILSTSLSFSNFSHLFLYQIFTFFYIHFFIILDCSSSFSTLNFHHQKFSLP